MDFFKKKSTYIAIAALLIVIISIISVTVSTSGSDAAGAIFSPVVSPIKRGMNSVVGVFEKIYNYTYKYDSLEEENKELKARVAKLEDDYREYSEISEENKRLRTLFDFAENHLDYKYAMGTIISWSSSNWSSSFTISLDPGSNIEPGDSVITESGYLVGHVTAVTSNSATVTTIIDTTMNIGALINDTGEAAVAEGDFELFQKGLLKLSYMQDSDTVMINSTIVTSGKGGMYPKDLVIGHVTEVVTPQSGLGTYAVIDPAADIQDLTHVCVITEYDAAE